MNIEQQLKSLILAQRKNKNPFIVAICGAADLGKTYLSKRLCLTLLEEHISCNHLTMDSFLKDRKIRKSLGISGYHLEAYNIHSLKNSLDKFIDKKDISFYEYNHKTGKSNGDLIHLKPSDILIIDGLHAISPELKKWINFSIFLFTDDKHLVKLRSKSDITKRQYSLAYSKEISQIELKRYKENVEPYQQFSDINLYIDEYWKYDFR